MAPACLPCISLVDLTVEARRRLSEVEGELKRRACAEEGLKMERSRLERRSVDVTNTGVRQSRTYTPVRS